MRQSRWAAFGWWYAAKVGVVRVCVGSLAAVKNRIRRASGGKREYKVCPKVGLRLASQSVDAHPRHPKL